MAGLLNNIISKIFGDDEPESLPDDGGLGEFAKQLAKELEEEEKSGKRPTVSADNVLKVQQGSRGSRAFMIDTTDFRRATVKELRESVDPVVRGILKSRCGKQGKGYMNVKAIYIFSVRREDPTEEYNAALDIIDDIGYRLLGDRYLKGDRLKVPVAKVIPDEFFKKDGGFNFKRAKETIKWVRDAGTHGPVDIDWKTGEVRPLEGSPEWVPDERAKLPDETKEWQAQSHKKQDVALGDWEKIERKRKLDEAENKEWQALEVKKPKVENEEWETFAPVAKPKPQVSITPIEKPAPKKHAAASSPVDETAEEIRLPKKQEGAAPAETKGPTPLKRDSFMLAFRPCWHASNEEINCYAVQPYQKVSGRMAAGEMIYGDSSDYNKILETDRKIIKKSIEMIMERQDVSDIKVVIPLHFQSLSIEKSQSPILPLLEMSALFKKSILIEIVSLPTNASPLRVASIISTYKEAFGGVGIRFELGDISRSVVERARADFLSCDIEFSQMHGKHLRGLDLDLPDLINLAKAFNMPVYAWGIPGKQELMFAIRKGCQMVNGTALAKDRRKLGKVTQVPANKLMNL